MSSILSFMKTDNQSGVNLGSLVVGTDKKSGSARSSSSTNASQAKVAALSLFREGDQKHSVTITVPDLTQRSVTQQTATTQPIPTAAQANTTEIQVLQQAEILFISMHYKQALSTLRSTKYSTEKSRIDALILEVKICTQLIIIYNENHSSLIPNLDAAIAKCDYIPNIVNGRNTNIAYPALLLARVQLHLSLYQIDLAKSDFMEILRYCDDTFLRFSNAQKDRDQGFRETLFLILNFQIFNEDFTSSNPTLRKLSEIGYQPEIINCFKEYALLRVNEPDNVKKRLDYFSEHISNKGICYLIALQLRAMIYFQIRNFKNASADFELYCSKHSSRGHEHFKMRAQIAAGRSTHEALKFLEKLNNCGGNYKQAASEVLEYYLKKSDFKNAHTIIESIRSKFKDNSFDIEYAYTFLMLGKPNETIKILETTKSSLIKSSFPPSHRSNTRFPSSYAECDYFQNSFNTPASCTPEPRYLLTTAYFLTNQYFEVLRVSRFDLDTHVYWNPNETSLYCLYRIASFLALGYEKSANRTIQTLLSLAIGAEELNDGVEHFLKTFKMYRSSNDHFMKQACEEVLIYLTQEPRDQYVPMFKDEFWQEVRLTKIVNSYPDRLLITHYSHPEFSLNTNEPEKKVLIEVNTLMKQQEFEAALKLVGSLVYNSKNICVEAAITFASIYYRVAKFKPVVLSPAIDILLALNFRLRDEKPPELYQAHYLLTQLSFGRYKLDLRDIETKLFFNSLILLTPGNPYENQALLSYGEVFFWNFKYEYAEKLFAKVTDPDLKPVAACFLHTIAFLRSGKAIDEQKLKLIDNAFNTNPRIPEKRRLKELLALIYYKLDQIDTAKAYIEEALIHGDLDSRAIILRAKIACHTSITAGLATFESLQKRDGEIQSAHLNLAKELYKDKKYTILVKLLDELIKLYPQNAFYFACRGRCKVHLNNLECMKDFAVVESLDLEFYTTEKLFLYKINALLRNQKYVEALDLCQTAQPSSDDNLLQFVRFICFTNLNQRNLVKKVLVDALFLMSSTERKEFLKKIREHFFEDYTATEIGKDPFLTYIAHMINTLAMHYAECYFWQGHLWVANSIISKIGKTPNNTHRIGECYQKAMSCMETISYIDNANLYSSRRRDKISANKKFMKALKHFLKLHHDPKFTEKKRIKELVAFLYFKSENFGNARRYHEESLKLGDPDDYKATQILSFKLACHTSIITGIECLKSLSIQDYEWALAQLFVEMQYSLIVKLLDAIINIYGNDKQYLSNFVMAVRGGCHFHLDNLEQCLKDFSKLSTGLFFGLPGNELYNGQHVGRYTALALYGLKKYDEALRFCNDNISKYERMYFEDLPSQLQLIRLGCLQKKNPLNLEATRHNSTGYITAFPELYTYESTRPYLKELHDLYQQILHNESADSGKDKKSPLSR